MKNRLLLFLSLFCANWLAGQSLSPQVVATAGDHFYSAEDSVQVSWTIGELVTETLGQDSTILTQGFHQTYLTVTAVEDLAADIQVEVFPNPTAGQVNVHFQDVKIPLQMALSDESGRTLMKQKASIQDVSNQFNLARMPDGVYYLYITTGDRQTIKTFKIVKTH
ncbi:MAG: T9SS C-terminal target domain-containing protein [Bacteroidetes bacterium]|nr:MAG: T9SS C-terminal target domain-containing protein [Bacteroidota bacterium]